MPTVMPDSYFWGTPDGPERDQWLRRAIMREVRYRNPDLNTDLLEPATDWFLEREDPMRYLVWNHAEEYRGEGWATGHWKIDMERVVKDMPAAIAAAINSTVVSLEEWLDLHQHSCLPQFAPAEPDGGHLVRDRDGQAAWTRHLAQRNAVRRHWPRPCETCGVEFRPRARNSATCPACMRAKRSLQASIPAGFKAKACRACAGEFTPRSGRSEFCDPCRVNGHGTDKARAGARRRMEKRAE